MRSRGGSDLPAPSPSILDNQDSSKFSLTNWLVGGDHTLVVGTEWREVQYTSNSVTVERIS